MCQPGAGEKELEWGLIPTVDQKDSWAVGYPGYCLKGMTSVTKIILTVLKW